MPPSFPSVKQDAIDMTCLLEAVMRAGACITDIHKQGAVASFKADASPVTQADQQAEVILTDALKQHYPEIQVVSEENPASHQHSPKNIFFLVDPLDGTRSFLHAYDNGHFTVNIGLVIGGEAVAGIIYAPVLDWLGWGSVQEGAFSYRNNKLTRLSRQKSPPPFTAPLTALVSRAHLDSDTTQFLDQHQITQTKSMASSLKFLALAAGEADIYPRFAPTMEWDSAAGEAILKAAGGFVTCDKGLPHLYGKKGWRNHAFIAYAHDIG